MRRIGAILVSGRGSNMLALLRAAAAPGYPVRFRRVFSDRQGAPALALARAHGVAAEPLPAGGLEAELDRRLAAAGVELVCLAGFLRILSPWFIDRWPGRVLNIHPSLLPRYPGLHTHARVLANGDAESGCSVHLVTPVLDDGPVLARQRVPVLAGDTPDRLAARVLLAEHRLYPATLAGHAATLPPLPPGQGGRAAPGQPTMSRAAKK